MRLDEETEEELEELMGRLDRLLPAEGARLAVSAGTPAPSLVGNRLGYLRLGLSLLRAALHPEPEDDEHPDRVVPRLEGLLTEGSAPLFAQCELDESIVSRPPAQSRFGALAQIGTAVALVAAVLAAFVAAAWLWRLVFG